MQSKTQKMMQEMVEYAQMGNKIIPMFWQPRIGASNVVSAAIKAAKNSGMIVEGGKDGCGKPFYIAPMPRATHSQCGVVQ